MKERSHLAYVIAVNKIDALNENGRDTQVQTFIKIDIRHLFVNKKTLEQEMKGSKERHKQRLNIKLKLEIGKNNLYHLIIFFIFFFFRCLSPVHLMCKRCK